MSEPIISADLLTDITAYVEAGDEFGPKAINQEVERLVKLGIDNDYDMRSWLDDGEDCDLGQCPYYLKQSGLPEALCGDGTYGPATCGFGCREEPSCITSEPLGGWESHKPIDVGGYVGQVPQFLKRWLEDGDLQRERAEFYSNRNSHKADQA